MPHYATVTEVEDFAPATRLLTLAWEVGDGQPPAFAGGQWLLCNSGVPLPDGKPAKRAYTILSPDSERATFQIAVRKIAGGPASNYLHTVATGDRLEFGGPYGKNYILPADDARLSDGAGPIFIVATETGITAPMGMLASERFAPVRDRVRLVWLLPDESDFLPPERVRAMLPENVRAALRVEYIAPPGEVVRQEEARRVLDDLMREHGTPGLAFLSGDGHVVKALKATLTVNGVSEEYIRAEQYFNNKSSGPAPADASGMRTGYTTGACSAAAARAATRALLTGKPLDEIETILPNKDTVTFALKRCELTDDRVVCSVIKDAGDDPDCTHGAELTASVRYVDTAGVQLRAGEGVATVTKPGLGLEVGAPAINPVPFKNITDMVRAELETQRNGSAKDIGIEVTISVPRGREMALETTNERLGLVGGISILGTTGIVKPYSTAAYRTSIVQGIEVARQRGNRELVMTTGGKSEQYAMEARRDLSNEAFIQVGDFIGVGVKHARRTGFDRAIIFGMMGKLSKMADGVIQTHQAGSKVNMEFLASLAGELGAGADVLEKIRAANTARHVLEICKEHGLEGLTSKICENVVTVMTNHAIGKSKNSLKAPLGPEERPEDFEVVCFLTDFDGNLLGRYPA